MSIESMVERAKQDIRAGFCDAELCPCHDYVLLLADVAKAAKELLEEYRYAPTLLHDTINAIDKPLGIVLVRVRAALNALEEAQ